MFLEGKEWNVKNDAEMGRTETDRVGGWNANEEVGREVWRRGGGEERDGGEGGSKEGERER